MHTILTGLRVQKFKQSKGVELAVGEYTEIFCGIRQSPASYKDWVVICPGRNDKLLVQIVRG